MYAIEKAARDLSDAERYRVRQEKSLPILKAFKTRLEKNTSKVMKGTRHPDRLLRTRRPENQ
jgi:hypothetical protein